MLLCALCYCSIGFGQTVSEPTVKSLFWSKVQFGGGLGLNLGSGYTDVTIAPGAIYNFNQYVAAGVGMQGSFVRVRDFYESYIYGGSLVGLYTPVEQLQLSTEFEMLRVITNFYGTDVDDNFWTPALFIGAGYRSKNVTFGIRYNVLYNNNKSVYSEPFMPFVRIYF